MIDLVVIGVGGFGRETLDVVEAVNRAQPTYRVIGVVDDGPSEIALERLAARAIAYLGTVDEYLAGGRRDAYVVGVGAPGARRRIAERLDAHGLRAATVIHPAAVIGSQSIVGTGVVVASGAQISTNVRLGDHVHLNPAVTIGHDSRLADFSSVNPGAIVSGEVTIEAGVLIGAGAVVLQGLTVGADSVVGASACVTRDVPAAIAVAGVPARRHVTATLHQQDEG